MVHLNLPDLARLTNDPIYNQTFWPPMPTKLHSDIPKFKGKEGKCPQKHIMMFHIWCSSNNIVDDLVRLILFQCTLTGVEAKWYLELPQAKYPHSTPWPLCSYSISSSPSDMMKKWKSCYISTKTLQPTSSTTSTNGGNVIACARSSLMTGYSWIGSLKACSHL